MNQVSIQSALAHYWVSFRKFFVKLTDLNYNLAHIGYRLIDFMYNSSARIASSGIKLKTVTSSLINYNSYNSYIDVCKNNNNKPNHLVQSVEKKSMLYHLNYAVAWVLLSVSALMVTCIVEFIFLTCVLQHFNNFCSK